MKAKSIITAALLTLCCVFCLPVSASTAVGGFTADMPKYEVRAVWLTTIGGIDWPRSHNVYQQKKELTDMLDQLKKAGVNTVHLQTRVRASTIYPSDMEPFDLCLTGTHGRSPGYDPLRFAVDECHRRGMECHAWMVTLPIGKWNEPRCKEFVAKHPDMVCHIGNEGYMDPENPQTGDYLARICAEVTSRYDIDGIHLDYIRYPETWPKTKTAAKTAKTRKGAKKGRNTVGSTVSATTPEAKRRNITDIVRKINVAVKKLKPWVKLSCSPIGKSGDLSRYRSGGWNAYQAVYQDAQGWLREGLMDQLYPMMYFRGNNFYPFALDWQERSYGRTIVSGLGIYFLSPREGNWNLDDITREMHFLRQNGIGHCYFRAKFLTDNTKNFYSFVRDFDNVPALIPPMTWQWQQAPDAPTQVSVSRGNVSDQLAWSGAVDRSNAPNLLYNVYASTTPVVDVANPRYLVATRVMGSGITIPHTDGQTLYYAVCALDRYGNESKPSGDGMKRGANNSLADNQCSMFNVQCSMFNGQRSMQKTDGRRLVLPSKPAVLQAEYIVIETMQGKLVCTVPFRGKEADISRLPDGVYVMRSIGRKGITHKLGYFSIRRRF